MGKLDLRASDKTSIVQALASSQSRLWYCGKSEVACGCHSLLCNLGVCIRNKAPEPMWKSSFCFAQPIHENTLNSLVGQSFSYLML